MSPGSLLAPRLATLQAAAAALLVGERAAAALATDASEGAYAAVSFAVGLWLLGPSPAWRAPGRAAALATAMAALFAAAACSWRSVWTRLAHGPLSAWLGDWGPWLLLLAVLLLDRAAVRRVLRLVRVELLKLAFNKLVRVGLVATAAVTALSGLTHDPLPGETAWGAVASMLGAGFATAQVFVLVLGATAIAGEASQGTLKMILPHAYRRSDWVLAKGAALALAAAAFAALVAAVALVGGSATGALGDVTLTAEGFGGEALVTVHAAAGEMRAHVTDVLATQALALAAVGALGLLVSASLNGVVGALCTAFLAFAALKLGDLVVGMDADTLRHVFLWPPERLREVTLKLGQGLSEAWDERLPALSLLLSAASAAVSVLLGLRLFGRRDLHV